MAQNPYITKEGDMLDLIAFRLFEQQAGMVERLYAANPNLANHSLFLPAGLEIQLPQLEQVTQKRPSLWE